MNKIIFIDTMTTGMNAERCGIYRLGGILTEDGVEKSRFEMRVRPFANARISEQSLWICGESRSSLVSYPEEGEALAFLLGILDGFVNVRNPKDKAFLAGFNSSAMDVPFLREFFRRNGNQRFRDYFYVQTIDLMTLSTFALLDRRGAMPQFDLDTAARELGIDIMDDGKYDCLRNARVCLDMYRVLQKRFCLGECLDTTPTEKTEKNY